MIIPGVALSATDIYAIKIINISISIIINTGFAIDFQGIFPHIGLNIRMGVIYACILYCHHHIFRASASFPCPGGLDIRSGGSFLPLYSLPGIEKAPLVLKMLVVRHVIAYG